MIKIFFFFLSLLLFRGAFALPVVNENAAPSGVLTVYPDHLDPHRYYIVPNVVTLAKDSHGIPLFSYFEVRKNIFQNMGVMTMTLLPAYPEPDLSDTEAQILKKDPAAQFTGVPFLSSSLQLTGALTILISENQCSHPAGLIGQEQACSLTLTPKGRAVFWSSLARKTIFITLDFNYEIQAVVRNADGTYENQTLHHTMAARIDGDQLSQFPQLISHR